MEREEVKERFKKTLILAWVSYIILFTLLEIFVFGRNVVFSILASLGVASLIVAIMGGVYIIVYNRVTRR